MKSIVDKGVMKKSDKSARKSKYKKKRYHNDIRHNDTRLQDFVAEYLQESELRKCSKNSIDTWRRFLNRFILFVESRNIKRIQDVSVKDLNQYRLELYEDGLEATSVYSYLSCLKSFFSFLEENQYIFLNPADKLFLPKYKRKLQPVHNEDEIAKLLEQPDVSTLIGIRDRALMEVLYSTACRSDEVFGMDIFDADLKNGICRVMGKGNKERIVPLGKQAVRWLNKYILKVRPKFLSDKNEPALWIGCQRGRRMHSQMIRKTVRGYGEQAGMKISTHGLRRATATHLLRGKEGMHPLELQQLLGHSSSKALRHYLKTTIGEIKEMHNKTKIGE